MTMKGSRPRRGASTPSKERRPQEVEANCRLLPGWLAKRSRLLHPPLAPISKFLSSLVLLVNIILRDARNSQGCGECVCLSACLPIYACWRSFSFFAAEQSNSANVIDTRCAYDLRAIAAQHYSFIPDSHCIVCGVYVQMR